MGSKRQKLNRGRKRRSVNYRTNVRREWNKSKKLPTIHCKQMKNAWDATKGACSNFEEMGLAFHLNNVLPIPTSKELLTPKDAGKIADDVEIKNEATKEHVVKELEAEASVPQERRLKLSQPDAAFCETMVEKYGDDYKAMARDAENMYQLTPKQIARKIQIYEQTRHISTNKRKSAKSKKNRKKQKN